MVDISLLREAAEHLAIPRVRYAFLVHKTALSSGQWGCSVTDLTKLHWPALPGVDWDVFRKLAPGLALRDDRALAGLSDAAVKRTGTYVRDIEYGPASVLKEFPNTVTYRPFYGPFLIIEVPDLTADALQAMLSRFGSVVSALGNCAKFLGYGSGPDCYEKDLAGLKFWR